MTIETVRSDRPNTLIVRPVPNCDLRTLPVSQAFDFLHDALDAIRADLDDKTCHYFAVDPARTSAAGADQVDVWAPENRAIWQSLADTPEGVDLANTWLDACAELLLHAKRSARRPVGFWESEDNQFAETAVATLAQQDLAFVAQYTRFIQIWDMTQEVRQRESIDTLFNTHGVCTETLDLMAVRLTLATGQSGTDQFFQLFPMLANHFNSHPEDKLFHHFVERIYGIFDDANQTMWSTYLEAKASEPDTPRPHIIPIEVQCFFPDPDLAAAAKEIGNQLRIERGTPWDV